MPSLRHTAARVAPSRAIPGGRIVVEAGDRRFSADPPRSVLIGSTEVWLSSSSSRRLAAVVLPRNGESGPVPIRLGDGEPIAELEIGAEWANSLHQVDSPAFDRDGNLYATFSGARGQPVPVSVFRVRPGGAPEPVASGIANATSLAFDRFGELCVSSRFDGAVYRIARDGTVEKIASDLGVACGLAFGPDGTMFVGDRTGTLFKVNAVVRCAPFAVLPPRIAAFHVAVRPRGGSLRQRPTLSSAESRFTGSMAGARSPFSRRPRAAAGARGGRGGTPTRPTRRRARAGSPRRAGRPRERSSRRRRRRPGVHPARGVAVASGDAVDGFERW